MKTQKVLSHKEVEYDILEECSICGLEMHNTKDILTDLNSGNYICQDCNTYYKLKAKEIKEI